MQTAKQSRNPSGARGLRAHAASLVVDDHSGRLPPRSLPGPRKPHARGPREFVTTLLTVKLGGIFTSIPGTTGVFGSRPL